MNSITPIKNIVIYKKYINDPKRFLEVIQKSESLSEAQDLFTPWSPWQGNWYGSAMNTLLPNNLYDFFKFGTKMHDFENEDQEYFFTELYTMYKDIVSDYIEKCKDVGPWPSFIDNWDWKDPRYWSASTASILKYTEDRDFSHDHDPENGYYNLAMNYHVDIGDDDLNSRGAKQIFTITFYINEDYENGELSFYNENDNNVYYYKTNAGDVTVFPSSKPYWHGVQPFSGKTRYLIRTFLMYNYPGSDEWLSNEEKYGSDKWEEMEAQRRHEGYHNNNHILDVILPGHKPDNSNNKKVYSNEPIRIQ